MRRRLLIRSFSAVTATVVGEWRLPPPVVAHLWRLVAGFLEVRGRRKSLRLPGPHAAIIDLAWVEQLRDKLRDQQEGRFKAEVRWRWGLLPYGQRILTLRGAMGWTQRQAASELGISRRTLIRHEQGQHVRPWIRIGLLLRLRQLETNHEEEIIAYLCRSAG